MSAREDATNAARAVELVFARGIELVSPVARNCDDFAGQLQAGGFCKPAQTLALTSAALRTAVLVDLAAAKTAATSSLNALASANTESLDIAATELAASQTHLAELRKITTATVETLHETAARIAKLGSRGQPIAAALRQTIDELDAALGHEQTATQATKEAINTLGASAAESDEATIDDAASDPGWVNAEDSTPEARAAYDRIRNSPEDIPKIAQNTGISENIIEEAWQNLFARTHDIATGPGPENLKHGRFTPDERYADLWDRVRDGKQTSEQYNEFRSLIAHEYVESRLIQEAKIPYLSSAPTAWNESGYTWDPNNPSAHIIAPVSTQERPDDQVLFRYWPILGLSPPPDGLKPKLENLDEIVRTARKGIGR